MVVLPVDPVASVRSGERAEFAVIHDRLDPFEQTTVSLIARTAVDRVNRQLLVEAVTEAQRRAAFVLPALDTAVESAGGLRSAVEVGDAAAVEAHRAAILGELEAVAAAPAVLLGAGLAEGETLTARIEEARQRVDDLAADGAASVEEAAAIEEDLVELHAIAGDLQAVDPAVLVSPFTVGTEVVGAVEARLTDFYAPGVIALLLQHLAITFAALSLVREPALGATELFVVAPLRTGETLIGKYLGFAVVAAVVGAWPVGGDDRPARRAVDGQRRRVRRGARPHRGRFAGDRLRRLHRGGLRPPGGQRGDDRASAQHLLQRLLHRPGAVGAGGPGGVLAAPHHLGHRRVEDVMSTGEPVPQIVWLVLGAGSVALFVAAWLLMRRRLRTVDAGPGTRRAAARTARLVAADSPLSTGTMRSTDADFRCELEVRGSLRPQCGSGRLCRLCAHPRQQRLQSLWKVGPTP